MRTFPVKVEEELDQDLHHQVQGQGYTHPWSAVGWSHAGLHGTAEPQQQTHLLHWNIQEEMCFRNNNLHGHECNCLLFKVIHCDSITARSSGFMGKTCVITDRATYKWPLFKIVNAASFQGFHICPTHHHLLWDISQCV